MSIAVYSWRRKDPRTGRWRVPAWKMTDDDALRWAAREGAELERVAGSEETRTDVGGYGVVFFPSQSTGTTNIDFEENKTH